ncbi:MAG: sugar ABC transporter substrate-binding protein, partial [Lachnospiraceae bacterium]|nr:sugar ABC transporter substrate-binding protein [Lachnospiraceae bacterium]
MKKKLVSAVLCTAMLTTILAGCGGGEAAPAATEPAAEASAEEAPAAAEEAPAAEEEASAEAEAPAASEGGRVIGYTCMDGTNPFFVALEGAIKEVVEAHGDTLVSM